MRNLKNLMSILDKAKGLTEKKRYYLSKFGHEVDDVIRWWKRKASNRYEKLKKENRLRTKLEIWEPGSDLEIIR